MNARPQTLSVPKFPPGYELAELNRSDLDGYRALFRKIGEEWLWHSRLTMSDEELQHILSDPLDEILALRHAGENVGLLELDFRQQGQCELAFFGLVSAEIGKRLGRALMNAAIERAWARPIRRFWVHTCTLDHPGALAFYIRSGFHPYAFQVEVQRDPRLTGHLPREAAPQVPIIE
jgi:GNAT superfamily N-acetyltransferase